MVKCMVAFFTLVKHSVLRARMSKTHSKMLTFTMEVLKTAGKTLIFLRKTMESHDILNVGLPCAMPFSATPIAICGSGCQKPTVKR